MPPREILIANRHPRLRLDRDAVARVIHTLDAHAAQLRPQVRVSARPARSPSALGLSPSSFPAVPAGELSLVFLTDPALAQLHADFLADPTPTDVITFTGDPAAGTAGEICLSADAALRQVSSTNRRLSSVVSAKEGPSPIALSTELTLYLVHGWLHLAGYDDLQPVKKRAMRRAEARAMKILRAAKALPRFVLRR
jgi:probable rRNA maturation factor